MGILLEILQYHNINFTFASGGIWSSSRSLSIIGEKVHFTYTFYWWKKSVSLSLSIGKKWPTQLHSLSLMVKYDPPHFHFLWVKYGPDNYFYFHQRWNMNSLQHCPWFPQSLVAGTMWELFDSVPLYRCRFFIVKALCIPVLTACSDRWFVGKGWSWKSESSNVVLWTCDGQKRS